MERILLFRHDLVLPQGYNIQIIAIYLSTYHLHKNTTKTLNRVEGGSRVH